MRGLRIILAVVLTALGACEKRSGVVKMTFVRSGGFGGPMMRVEGSVDFDGTKAVVKSDARHYQRELDAKEAADLQRAADPGSWPKDSGEGSPARDAFQYDVTVTAADGSTHKVRLYDQSSSALSTWLREESSRIFASK